MKKVFTNLVASCLLVGFSGIASAVVINGADLAADPRTSLPNGSSATVGTSVQFANLPGFSVLVDVDLSAFGFGTGAGQSSSGSIAVNSTRINSDSDFYFGLWDGVNFPALAFFDGDRVYGPMPNSTSDGTTVSPNFTGSATNISPIQNIGDAVTSVISFDLLGNALSLVVNGTTVNGTLGSLNTAGGLSLLIALDTSNESHQIDSIEIRGGNGGGSVPLPGTLMLLGLGLAVAGRRLRKQQ